MDHTSITAVILAGGRARRMGGKDKGLLLLNGKPLVQHVIERIEAQVDTLLINANRNTQAYEKFGYPVISDEYANFPGPLAGIAAALQHCHTDYLLTVPCDTPFLPLQLATTMLTQIKQENTDVCLAHDGRRLQPLVALISPKLAPELERAITAGHLKVKRWMLAQHHSIARFSMPADFMNINNEDELLVAQQHNLTP